MRAVAPFLAGSSGMRLRAFLPWSLLGTAAWATTFTLVGYAFHDSFTTAASNLTHAAFALAIVAAACSRGVRTAARAPRRLLETGEQSTRLQGCGTSGTEPGALPCLKRIPVGNKPFVPDTLLITKDFLSAQARLAVGMAE